MVKQLSFLTLSACAAGGPTVLQGKTSQVFVRDIIGKTHTLDVTTNTPVTAIQDALYDLTGLLPRHQLLCCGKQTIPAGELSLLSCGVLPGDFLQLSPRIKGAGKFPFTKFSDKNTSEITKFSSDAPSWRIIRRGINLEGACENPACEAAKARNGKAYVWADFVDRRTQNEIDRFKGIILNETLENAFSIEDLRFNCVCPICKKRLKPDSVQWCGFYACKYDITGTQPDSLEDDDCRNQKIAAGDGFVYFDKDPVEWSCIHIVVQKLNNTPNLSLEKQQLIKAQLLRRRFTHAEIADLYNASEQQVANIAHEMSRTNS